MTIHIETLITRARIFWDEDKNIPLDLAAEMFEAGLIVDELENQYRS